MKPSLVSVIIPCYNYGRYLGESLESVLSQTWEELEIIVIDDGSTDCTAEVAKRLMQSDRRVKYHYQKNSGRSASRNTGLKLATGDFVQFLDADDLLEPAKIEKSLELFHKSQGLDIVYSDMRYFKHGQPNEHFLNFMCTSKDDHWMPRTEGEGLKLVSALTVSNIMVTSSPLIKIDLTKKVGFFDENLDVLEDWDFWLRCAVQGGKFRYCDAPESRTLIRTHESSVSQDQKMLMDYQLQFREAAHEVLNQSKYRGTWPYWFNLDRLTQTKYHRAKSKPEELLGRIERLYYSLRKALS